MDQIIAKFLKGILTSIVIFYSKKFVYFIDDFFNRSIEGDDITCSGCGAKYKSYIFEQINENNCFHCDNKILLNNKDDIFNEYRR